jgi:parvulin-like peptidyl-prolyl isomerase
MTTGLMLQQRAIDLGLTASDTHVAMVIRDEPAFQVNGKFDLGRFNAILNQAQMTEEQLADSIRNETLRGMVLAGVGVGMRAPKFMTTAMYQSRYAMREIEFTSVKFSDFNVSANPTEQQLRETFAKNPHVIPESRKVSYVLIPAKMSQPDNYDTGYKTAQKLEDDLISGESMAKAAAKLNAKFVSVPAISMGQKSSDAIVAAVNVFAMEQGIESEIIETKSGFVIVRVENITPQHNAPFESVKTDLVAKWKLDQQEKMAYKKANELLIKLNAGGGLSGGKSVTVGRANGAPAEVLNIAFANQIGTKTIVPATNAFYVLNVKKAIPASINADKQAALEKEANMIINRALSDDYMAFMQRKYPIKINQKVYKRLIGE